jgi:hypothetical protein
MFKNKSSKDREPNGDKEKSSSNEFRKGVLEISMPAPESAERGTRSIEIGGHDTQKQTTGKAKVAGQK